MRCCRRRSSRNYCCFRRAGRGFGRPAISRTAMHDLAGLPKASARHSILSRYFGGVSCPGPGGVHVVTALVPSARIDVLRRNAVVSVAAFGVRVNGPPLGQKTSNLKCGSFSALWHCWQASIEREASSHLLALVNCGFAEQLRRAGASLSPGATPHETQLEGLTPCSWDWQRVLAAGPVAAFAADVHHAGASYSRPQNRC